ncbi:hypothetical protein [Paraburkholderia sp. BCC1885]|uniref:hypothetical protein n=1 Tax=Paraburkholderia sp. BCC1885 TaxID=2562669 RepID=UPI001183A6EC|nr:hypothetical protein [Paraburkholderia sp. BCC1885]
MLNREKPSLKIVIDTIAQHGPSDIEQLIGMLPMSHTPIYKLCKLATEQGYLSSERIKKEGVCGRRHLTYTRTEKPYAPPKVSEKTLRNRRGKERARMKAERMNGIAQPFRHWQDALLFGSYPKSFEPTLVAGRIFKQSMEVTEDELEEQAA